MQSRMRKIHLIGENFMFLELHMTRDPKSLGNRVIAAITFLIDAIAKEVT
jgi:hypothetical protein